MVASKAVEEAPKHLEGLVPDHVLVGRLAGLYAAEELRIIVFTDSHDGGGCRKLIDI